ncbi:MAG TPA: hypothetical protein VJ986_13230 [Gaiellaceae bacterium]|nr:hypothetical protein [Gaiellaceae bacterium]
MNASAEIAGGDVVAVLSWAMSSGARMRWDADSHGGQAFQPARGERECGYVDHVPLWWWSRL